MELDEREKNINGMVLPIFLTEDSQPLRREIKLGDMATLYSKGSLIEAVIKFMEDNFFIGSIFNADNPDFIGSEIKFAEKNIFSVVENYHA